MAACKLTKVEALHVKQWKGNLGASMKVLKQEAWQFGAHLCSHSRQEGLI
jgi:hypothetical protein